MPLSKNHPTQRSSELTAPQINHQQSKGIPRRVDRPTLACIRPVFIDNISTKAAL